MTLKKPWGFTIHALSRVAKRFGLIADREAQQEISRLLDFASTFLKVERKGYHYEFQFRGVKMIAVCDPTDRTVITFVDPKKWARACRNRTPSVAPKRKYMKQVDEEE